LEHNLFAEIDAKENKVMYLQYAGIVLSNEIIYNITNSKKILSD